jgi:flagellar basal-body rod modification protein FlgD
MTTTGTTGIGGVAAGLKPAETAAMQGIDKDAFMKLLVAQLRYQNPMSPTDPNQFMAQSAQFTMVEKLTQLADSQTESVSLQRNLTAAALIGRDVEWQGTDGARDHGVVTGTKVTADGPILVVGTKDIPFAQLLAVRAANPTT